MGFVYAEGFIPLREAFCSEVSSCASGCRLIELRIPAVYPHRGQELNAILAARKSIESAAPCEVELIFEGFEKDPRRPWNAGMPRRVVDHALSVWPEVLRFLTPQSFEVARHCMRQWSISNSCDYIEINKALGYSWLVLDQVQRKEWFVALKRAGVEDRVPLIAAR